MGTRNLTAVVIDGQHKVAQYGQWDGYPKGQGDTILKFLAALPMLGGMDEFKRKVRGCTFLTQEQIQERWKAAGADDSGWVGLDVGRKFSDTNPQLSRDTGAGVLQLIAQSDNGLELDDEWQFAADSLFCEYAYVLDLDAGTLELYRGFNTEPLPQGQRFSDMAPSEAKGDIPAYYPVRLAATWSLEALPTVDDMEEACRDPEEETQD